MDICPLPVGPQLSFLSSQWKVEGHCRREGASLPNSSFLFSLLASVLLVQFGGHAVGLIPRQFQQPSHGQLPREDHWCHNWLP